MIRATFRDAVQRVISVNSVKELCKEMGIDPVNDFFVIYVNKRWFDVAQIIAYHLYSSKIKGKIEVIAFSTSGGIIPFDDFDNFWAVKSESKFGFSLGDNSALLNNNDWYGLIPMTEKGNGKLYND